MTINLNAVSPSLKTRLACANGSRNTFANQTIFLDFFVYSLEAFSLASQRFDFTRKPTPRRREASTGQKQRHGRSIHFNGVTESTDFIARKQGTFRVRPGEKNIHAWF